ncbi:hypothetical protein, variant 1 [Spizellomyces punctatus DAOM BR117]|uniref:Uncharacterized protein n=1 Tax=Spizellomyces punctatus (strain DAOM BR117) TaxID=645134 RepID=A0A0L0HCP8_SPIPD|nr:hypothetical protein, variant 1 [Spizellomyces punctatus DAOM BR117]KNC98518.1 hypothetical protein, variant 1 [Spizellomyces punctatus DAOM BR117]|eukprot:XP_016606558.1 hypothetical protein, variant 1 [Spizellomyces punctatus DAOM BR117]
MAFRSTRSRPRLEVASKQISITERESVVAPFNKQEHLDISPTNLKLLNTLSQYICLWSLSLAYCRDVSPALVSAISKYAGLGFLDISFTNLDFKTLQTILRPVRVLQLRCIGCSKLMTAEGTPERRGFAVMALPEVWMLDGVFITWHERKTWADLTKMAQSMRVRLADLASRELIPFDPAFVPSRYADDAPDSEVPAKLWSPRAKMLLKRMPVDFCMGVEEDLWKLKVLAIDLENEIKHWLAKKIKNPTIVEGTISVFAASSPPWEDTHVDDQNGAYSLASRTILALLLFGSMWPEFPHRLLQRVLEAVFVIRWDANARLVGGVDHWAREPASPLSWPMKYRLTYLAILVGRLTLESISETSIKDDPPLISQAKLKTLREVLIHFVRASYSPSHTPMSKPDTSISVLAQRVRSFLTPEQQYHLAGLHLDVIQMACLDDASPRDFLNHMDALQKAYSHSLNTLLSKDVPLYQEVCISDKDMDIMRTRLAVDDQETTSHLEENSTDMSLEACALELKFRLCHGIEQVVGFLDQRGNANAPIVNESSECLDVRSGIAPLLTDSFLALTPNVRAWSARTR